MNEDYELENTMILADAEVEGRSTNGPVSISRDQIQDERDLYSLLENKDPSVTEWTEEMHSMYLNSMEASFVKQLYNDELLTSWKSRRQNQMDVSHSKSHYTSGQFKVFQNGCWGKLNFERAEIHSNDKGTSRNLLANPWIKHYKMTSQGSTLKDVHDQHETDEVNCKTLDTLEKMHGNSAYGLPTSSRKPHPCCSHVCQKDSICTNEEMSDQNFFDDHCEADELQSNIYPQKRTRIGNSSSHKDQVVPFGNSVRISSHTSMDEAQGERMA